MGCSRTPVDNLIYFISGEYEDSYDEDFFIYSYVHVLDTKKKEWRRIKTNGDVLPPTDFHTAVYFKEQNSIYIFGCIGRENQKEESKNLLQVYCFQLDDYTWKKVEMKGEIPPYLNNVAIEKINENEIILGIPFFLK